MSPSPAFFLLWRRPRPIALPAGGAGSVRKWTDKKAKERHRFERKKWDQSSSSYNTHKWKKNKKKNEKVSSALLDALIMTRLIDRFADFDWRVLPPPPAEKQQQTAGKTAQSSTKPNQTNANLTKTEPEHRKENPRRGKELGPSYAT